LWDEYHLVNLDNLALFAASSMIPILMFLPNSLKNDKYLSFLLYAFSSLL